MAPNDPTIDLVHQAYGRLSHDELLLFLKIRSLPTSGTDAELASRLTHHDLHTYHFVGHNQGPSSPPSSPPPTLKSSNGFNIDIVADIMDQVGDWELAKAVGVPTSIPRPIDWARAAPIDHAMLAGHIPLIRSLDPANNPPTKVGAVAAVRFGYVHVLEFFLSHHHDMFLSLFSGDIIPIKASRHGRTGVLSWWKHGFQKHPDLIPPPKAGSISEAVDGASRNGQIISLEWWLGSGLPFEYSDAALEHASAKNQVAVLEWWKQMSKKTGMPLKIGRVMDAASTAGHVAVLEWWAASQLDFKYDRYALHQASCHGRVDVLDWWLGSGLQLIFDQDVLTGATRHNRADVLEWWDKSGLPIQYRMCDIEEALEDAIGGGAQARAWWKRKGVDFHADDKVWMKLQNLN
ncbi:SAP domain-containing protein [Pleurotus pulmonarius]